MHLATLILVFIASYIVHTPQLFGQSVIIDLWEQDPPALGQEMDKWIAIFSRQHPDVSIRRQNFDNETLRTKFLRSSLTGDGADLLYGPNDLVGVLASAASIQPTGSWIDKNLYRPELIRLLSYEKQIWGVPVSAGSHLVLYYNKKFTDQAPTSFTELIQNSKAFMQRHHQDQGLTYYMSEPYWFVPFMGAFDAWPIQSSPDGSITITIDQPGTVKALSFTKQLFDKYKIIQETCDFDCSKAKFLAGQALYHINGDWTIAEMVHTLGDKLGIAPLPYIDSPSHPMTPMAGGRFFFINRSTSGKKLAMVKKFIEFTSKKIVQQRLASELHRIPAIKALDQKKLSSHYPLVGALADAQKHAKDFPKELEMRAAWDGMRIMLQRAYAGKETVAQAAKTGQKAAEEALVALRNKK